MNIHHIAEGRELRDSALALLEAKRQDWIIEARAIARRIAEIKGCVTINDVREAIAMPDDFHPNTWGAVMKDRAFKAVGFDQAHHPAAHARVVRIYRLQEAA